MLIRPVRFLKSAISFINRNTYIYVCLIRLIIITFDEMKIALLIIFAFAVRYLYLEYKHRTRKKE